MGEAPLRERLHGFLMLALYRSGRQAEALRAFQDARGVLGDELGLEPGPELRALEAAILGRIPPCSDQLGPRPPGPPDAPTSSKASAASSDGRTTSWRSATS